MTVSMFAFAMAATLVCVSALPAQDAALVEKGHKLYASQKCQTCHSIGGKWNKKGPLDGVGSKLSEEDIRAWLVTPEEMTAKSKSTRKPPMKSYKSLPQEDIDALVAYMKSLK